MAGYSVVTLQGETEWFLLWSPRLELFRSVELYLGDGLEMLDNSVATVAEKLSMVVLEASQDTDIFKSIEL